MHVIHVRTKEVIQIMMAYMMLKIVKLNKADFPIFPGLSWLRNKDVDIDFLKKNRGKRNYLPLSQNYIETKNQLLF